MTTTPHPATIGPVTTPHTPDPSSDTHLTTPTEDTDFASDVTSDRNSAVSGPEEATLNLYIRALMVGLAGFGLIHFVYFFSSLLNINVWISVLITMATVALLCQLAVRCFCYYKKYRQKRKEI